MPDSGVQQIAVLGAGILGGQIAWQSAYKGKDVIVYDISQDALDGCQIAQQSYSDIYSKELGASQPELEKARERLAFTTDLGAAVSAADLVIEAVPEIPEIKTSVYTEMATHLPSHTIVATNSSTLLPSDFAAASGRPERFCAMHFANLIWHMNLCEIMGHSQTDEATLCIATKVAIEIGMVPIPVLKEQNAYVLNTMLIALLQASQTLVTNGVSTPEVVDRTYMIMNRGCAAGPFGIIDIVGMKTAFDIFNHWGTVDQDEQMLKSAEYLDTNFISKGLMGLQAGEGYYSYPNPLYAEPDFLDAPDISEASAIAALTKQ